MVRGGLRGRRVFYLSLNFHANGRSGRARRNVAATGSPTGCIPRIPPASDLIFPTKSLI